MRGALRRLPNDERGVAAIELAMIAPVLALVMLGSLDLARAIATKISLEQAANRAMHLAEVWSGIALTAVPVVALGAFAVGWALRAAVRAWRSGSGAAAPTHPAEAFPLRPARLRW